MLLSAFMEELSIELCASANSDWEYNQNIHDMLLGK